LKQNWLSNLVAQKLTTKLTSVTENPQDRASADRIVWIDCEMTGLDFKNDLLVEIACIITDAELNEIDEGFQVVITAPQEKLDLMDPVVVTMHTESGLLPEIQNGVSLQEAEAALFEYISDRVPEANKAPLAGSSVHVDRIFLQRDMPRVDSYLHYRIIDVSSIKELTRRWYPKLYFASPVKIGNHRALGDIKDSIIELRYYREVVFVDQPGPSADKARKIAAKLAPHAN
jgi:oligoribonuclease